MFIIYSLYFILALIRAVSIFCRGRKILCNSPAISALGLTDDIVVSCRACGRALRHINLMNCIVIQPSRFNGYFFRAQH